MSENAKRNLYGLILVLEIIILLAIIKFKLSIF